jgi:hypothetical protein
MKPRQVIQGAIFAKYNTHRVATEVESTRWKDYAWARDITLTLTTSVHNTSPCTELSSARPLVGSLRWLTFRRAPYQPPYICLPDMLRPQYTLPRVTLHAARTESSRWAPPRTSCTGSCISAIYVRSGLPYRLHVGGVASPQMSP